MMEKIVFFAFLAILNHFNTFTIFFYFDWKMIALENDRPGKWWKKLLFLHFSPFETILNHLPTFYFLIFSDQSQKILVGIFSIIVGLHFWISFLLAQTPSEREA